MMLLLKLIVSGVAIYALAWLLRRGTKDDEGGEE